MSNNVLRASINRVSLLSAGMLFSSAVLAADTWTPPMTSWFVPDFQGIWDYSSRTALERHPRFKGKLTVTMEKAERFYKVNDRELRYQLTVEDSELYQTAWAGELAMYSSPDLYEYACHEGNHSIPGILMGARVLEQLGN